MYGANSKALLATRAVFSLTHKYGDILREGWRNLVECLLQLFQCRLLPQVNNHFFSAFCLFWLFT